ncbi:MAG: hypothetical protein K1X81_06225 [Bacteroidia bacterium]|nr:hypothetical protein [Bacteroidia bacterium]
MIKEEVEVNVKDLDTVLSYKNDMVIHKFLESYSISFEEAEDLFLETKRWLWFCAKTTQNRLNGEKVVPLLIHKELTFLDEMWHTFILFTKDYSEFCKKNFGFYVHHAPTTKDEKDKSLAEKETDLDQFKKKVVRETRSQYEFVFDILGRETLIKWYYTYPEKYTTEFIKKVRT